ncbi:MAG: DNA-formamidopyrimidine glycosylase family protein, partial [Planctomycetota bacterium]
NQKSWKAGNSEGGGGGLLMGRVVVGVERVGKRLAIVGDDGSAVGVHLGMSGRVLVFERGQGVAAEPFGGRHTHARWWLGDGDGARVVFVDHRRFGGLWDWAVPKAGKLEGGKAGHRSVAGAVGEGEDEGDVVAGRGLWFAGLGPDALAVGPAELWRGLSGTRRCVKAALLDQRVVAGLGNIYVDELLFGAGVSPLRRADRVSRAEAAGLVRRMRTLLCRAIEAGGSTLRDYADASGRAGGYQLRHRVYGRGGLRCRRRGCGGTLVTGTVAGRTTVWCPVCQPR